MELTTVADDQAVVHDGLEVRRYDDLEPDTVYEFDGFAFRTLARPAGELLCHFATVNDVHFGEVECGIIDGIDLGPTFRVADGEEPYPEMMNRGAIARDRAARPRRRGREGRPHLRRHRRASTGDFLEFYERGLRRPARRTCGATTTRYHGADLRRREPAQRVDLPGRDPRRDRHVDRRPAPAARSPASSSSGSHDLAADADRPGATCSATTTSGAPSRASGPTTTSASTPTSSVRLVEVVAARPASAATSPATPTATGCAASRISRDVPVGRGGLR